MHKTYKLEEKIIKDIITKKVKFKYKDGENEQLKIIFYYKNKKKNIKFSNKELHNYPDRGLE